MFGRFRFSSPLALVCGVAVTTLSGTALGQVVSTGTPAIERDPERTSTSTDPDVALTLTRGDCKNEKLVYTFNVNVAGYKSSYELEAWAGESNCVSEYANADSTKTCWKLGDLDVDEGVAKGEFTPQELFGIGMSGGKPILSSCDDTDVPTSRQYFNVYVMLTSSGAVQGTAAAFTVNYDLGGPDAPENVSVKIAESSLKVSWTPVEDEEGEIEYELWCAPRLASQGDDQCYSALSVGDSTSSGGSGGEGGTTTTTGGSGGSGGSGGTADATSTGGDSGGTTDTATTSSGGSGGNVGGSAGASSGGSSTPTVTADPDDAFLCGTIRGNSSKSGFAKPLDNGTPYSVAVVAVDQYGNKSVYSERDCATPQLLTSFFERYRDDGGKAGGGFCSLKHSARSLSSAGLLLLSLGALAQLRRRKAARSS